jgi:hypothetical protein
MMVREIPLTRGFVALVDEADYARVSAKKWAAQPTPRGRAYAYHYWRVGKRGFGVSLQRFLMQPGPGLVVDHINGDPLDNRRANLRVCHGHENARNRRKATGEHRFKCVKLRGKRYETAIKVGDTMLFLGSLGDATAAALLYDRVAPILHGEFASLNFSPGRDWIFPSVDYAELRAAAERLERRRPDLAGHGISEWPEPYGRAP